jgi:hypothetical protein
MGIMHTIKRVESKGVKTDLAEMIVDAKKQQKDDIEFLNDFEKTYDKLVPQNDEECEENIIDSIQLYLEEWNSVLLEDFQDFFDTSDSD